MMRARHLLILCAFGLAGCAAAPSSEPNAPIGVAAPSGATSMDIFEQLKSDDDAIAINAVATVEANPGAYLPAIMGGVAREMFEHGRRDDALLWNSFGMLRMMEDLNYEGTFNDRATHMSLLLMLSYQTDEGEALIAARDGLPVARRRALLEAADAMNARYPRLYPHDWGLTGRDAYEVNFVAEPAPWSPEQIAALDALHADMLSQFRDLVQSQAPGAEHEKP
jgi:hypothetical protein